MNPVFGTSFANLKLINLFRRRLRLPCLPDRQAADKGRSLTSGDSFFFR